MRSRFGKGHHIVTLIAVVAVAIVVSATVVGPSKSEFARRGNRWSAPLEPIGPLPLPQLRQDSGTLEDGDPEESSGSQGAFASGAGQQVPPGVAISGRVVDLFGAPVVAATVSVISDGRVPDSENQTLTDERGRFVVAGAQTMNASLLRIQCDGMVDTVADVERFQNGGPASIVCMTGTASLTVLLLAPGDEPFQGAKLHLTTPSGTRAVTREFEGSQAVLVDGLPPGSVAGAVVFAGRSVLSTDADASRFVVELCESETKVVNLAVPATGRLRVTGLVSTQLALMERPGGIAQYLTSSMLAGVSELAGVRPGRYWLVGESPLGVHGGWIDVLAFHTTDVAVSTLPTVAEIRLRVGQVEELHDATWRLSPFLQGGSGVSLPPQRPTRDSGDDVWVVAAGAIYMLREHGQGQSRRALVHVPHTRSSVVVGPRRFQSYTMTIAGVAGVSEGVAQDEVSGEELRFECGGDAATLHVGAGTYRVIAANDLPGAWIDALHLGTSMLVEADAAVELEPITTFLASIDMRGEAVTALRARAVNGNAEPLSDWVSPQFVRLDESASIQLALPNTTFAAAFEVSVATESTRFKAVLSEGSPHARLGDHVAVFTTVSGTVVDADGAPLAGVPVTARVRSGIAASGLAALTSSAGVYHLRVPTCAEIALQANLLGYVGKTVCVYSGDNGAEVCAPTIRLELGGFIDLHCSHLESGLTVPIPIQVRARDGQLIARSTVVAGAWTVVGPLQPGEYEVTAKLAGYEASTLTVAVEENAFRYATIELQTAGR